MASIGAPPPNDTVGFPKRHVTGMLESVTSLWVLCAKHASRVSRKLRAESSRSALARPKRLLATISNKAIRFRERKRSAKEEDFDLDAAGAEFGGGGLWQRTILMGDKCQPLDFSGVIYYDSNGKQLPEVPIRSPRASPLPSYLYAAAGKREEQF